MNIPKYQIVIKKKIVKSMRSVPQSVQDAFVALCDDLEEKGPFQPDWPNYSPLKNDKYHCHLSHNYVACWEWVKGTIIIEVLYAGSRESAPYDKQKS